MISYAMIAKKKTKTKKEAKKIKIKKKDSLSAREALKSSFVIPTVEEVQQYLDEIDKTRFSGEDFCNYYEANGWMANEGCPVKSWKAMVRTWRKRERKAIKGKDNVTNTNQQRQAAGAGAQAAGAVAREEHRKEDLERHLASHHPGDDRLAKLAREIDEVAQEVGVPTTEYTLQQIAYDAQALLYRMVFCEGWTDEKWLAAMAYVKGQMTKKGAKRLGSSTLLELVYEFSKVKR